MSRNINICRVCVQFIQKEKHFFSLFLYRSIRERCEAYLCENDAEKGKDKNQIFHFLRSYDICLE